jgi:hypothetical protein
MLPEVVGGIRAQDAAWIALQPLGEPEYRLSSSGSCLGCFLAATCFYFRSSVSQACRIGEDVILRDDYHRA